MNKKFTKFVASINILCVFSNVALASPAILAAQEPDRLDALREHFNLFRGTIVEIQDQIDRSQFDLSVLVESLDYDEKKAIDFVSRKIDFEPYLGLLRGAQGTLFARAGNALDQAVLLAGLLKDTGAEVRIASATLSEQQANVVLRNLKPRVGTSPSPYRDADEVERLLKELTGQDPDSQLSLEANGEWAVPFVNFAKEQAASIYAALPDSAKLNFDNDERKRIIDEVQDYYWVQYRISSGQSWQNVHPVLGEEANPFELTPQRYFVDTIPQELQHRIRVELSYKTVTSDEETTVPLIEPWEQPTATNNAQNIYVSNVPTDNREDLGSFTDEELERLMFVPIVGSSEPLKAFDMSGNLVDIMATGNQASSVFANVNKSFSDANEAIGGDNIPAFAGQILTVSHIRPDGVVRSQTRVLTKHNKESVAAQMQNNLFALTADYSINIANSPIPSAYAESQQLDTLIAFIDFALNALDSSSPQSARSIAEVKRTIGVAAHALWHSPSVLDDSKRSFLTAPSIVLTREDRLSATNRVQYTDILHSSVRALRVEEEGWSPNLADSLYEGVWRTTIEQSFVREVGDSPDISVDPSWAHGRSMLIDNGAALENDYLSQPSRQGIRSQVEGGAFAVVTGLMRSGQQAWWKVDLEHNETIGYLEDGKGGQLNEYITKGAVGMAKSITAARFVEAFYVFMLCYMGAAIVNSLSPEYVPNSPFPVPNSCIAAAQATLIVGVVGPTISVVLVNFYNGLSEILGGS